MRLGFDLTFRSTRELLFDFPDTVEYPLSSSIRRQTLMRGNNVDLLWIRRLFALFP